MGQKLETDDESLPSDDDVAADDGDAESRVCDDGDACARECYGEDADDAMSVTCDKYVDVPRTL